MQDPRIGRFFATDPLEARFSWWSPYQFAGNSPILYIDVEGKEPTKPELYWQRLTKAQEKQIIGKDLKRTVIFVTEGFHNLPDNSEWLPSEMLVARTYSESEVHDYYYNKTLKLWIEFDKNDIGASAGEVSKFAAYSIAAAGTIVGGLLIIETVGWAATAEFILEESVEYAVEYATGIPIINPKDIADGVGVIYRRFNKTTGKYYIGQAKSLKRYEKRQLEHAEANPDAEFEFEIIGSADPGKKLDVLEESMIRKHGVPTTKKTGPDGNNTGTLENKRYQMNDKRYKEAGGTEKKFNESNNKDG